MDAWRLFFGFRGRINRAKYWLALLILFTGDAALTLLGRAAGGGTTFQVVSHAVNLAIFVSTLALGIKRLHDRDRAAWWLLLFYIGPFLVGLAGWLFLWTTAGSFGDTRVVSLFLLRLSLLAGIALAIWGQVEIGFRRGTAGYNRFGADPLAKSDHRWSRPRRDLVIGATTNAPIDH
jgi:uncharacterized membrane protein YhaH (DUF805 family)